MKRLEIYYFVTIIPVVIIFTLKFTDMISNNWFVYSFVAYLLLYRTYTDGRRLAEKGIIEKRDIWKMIIPGQRFKYFKELYLQ